MSLQDNWSTEIPEDTKSCGEQLLPADNPYRLVGEHVTEILSLADFRALYSQIGRGALCPIILALVTVFQFLERIPDRAAAQWAVLRLDWKYALHVPLLWPGFHFSSLSKYRQRLMEHEAERLVFERVLQWVQAYGLLKKHGQQRTDSTYVVGCVERLTRLELVWETLRVALRALKQAAPTWFEETLPAVFQATYQTRRSEWQLSDTEIAAEMQQAGRDGVWLLSVLADAPSQVDSLVEIDTLQRVWAQQFEVVVEAEPRVEVRPPSGRGKGKDLLVSPHDPEARWSKKRDTEWRGYKMHVTETVEDDPAGRFITDICAVTATEDDSETTGVIQQRLVAQDVPPEQHYVDQGYTSGANLAQSQARGIELVGPVGDDTAGKPAGYRQSDFRLDFATQQARCPQGQVAPKWYPRPQADGYLGAEIQFRDRCNDCPVQAQCAPGKNGRTLKVNPYHALLAQRRAEQHTPAFKHRMHRRAAIEGTISELTRTHGARRARYRGQSKVHLQMLFIGAAVNLKRAARAIARQATAVPQASQGAYDA